MSVKEKYDTIVIGAGKAGTPLALGEGQQAVVFGKKAGVGTKKGLQGEPDK